MALPHDYIDIGPISIGELAELEIPRHQELVYISTPGNQTATPYNYSVLHSPGLKPRKPSIAIRSTERGAYLRHGSEADAQTAIRGLTAAFHEMTAGVIDIHPFYGTIYHDILDPVAEDWARDPAEHLPMGDCLSTRIELVAGGEVFSDTLSEDAAEIPLTFAVPSLEADRWLANMILADQVNPNQRNKDQATANGLGRRWQAAFDKHNPADILRREPMSISPGSVALLMEALEDRGIFSSPEATVRVRQPV